MTRDNQERLSLFAGTQIQIVRLALNMNQIEQYNPPPNPAKFSDSRAEEYVKQYGHQSWELDALEPNVIHNLIRDAIMRVRDEKAWEASFERENVERQQIEDAIENAGLGVVE